MENEKKLNIENYGEVVLKKFTFADKCELKGKIVNISIDNRTGIEKTEIDSGAIFFWTTALSIKSLPNHPDFHSYEKDMKVKILSAPEMAGSMEKVMSEALEFNKLNTQDIGKKNLPSSEEKAERPDNQPKA